MCTYIKYLSHIFLFIPAFDELMDNPLIPSIIYAKFEIITNQIEHDQSKYK